MLSTLDTLKHIKVPEPTIDLINVSTKIFELNQKVSKLEEALKPKKLPAKIKKVTVHRIEKPGTPPKPDEVVAQELNIPPNASPIFHSKPIITLELSASQEK